MPKTVSKTFRLTPSTVAAMQDLVDAGRAQSQTALLESLIARERIRLSMEQEDRDLDLAWATAMKSAEYRAELAEVEESFITADSESSRMID